MVPLIGDGERFSFPWVSLVLVVMNVVLFPCGRELYYRFTGPILDGVGQIFFIGILSLIAWAVRIVLYILLWAFSFIIGLIGFLYLGVTESLGHGWRVEG